MENEICGLGFMAADTCGFLIISLKVRTCWNVENDKSIYQFIE